MTSSACGRTHCLAVVVCLCVAVAATGCAAKSPEAASSSPSVEGQIAKTRAIASRATPQGSGLAVTVESWDEQLRDALAMSVIEPTAERHRRVAAQYERFGILDLAFSHLTKAAEIDPNDAAAHDALARIWRDWGFAHLGLAEGLRAAELAPDSAAAANTVGTLYAALGRLSAAHVWYNKALTLDPTASYALNNVCYSAVRLGQRYAASVCEKAVAAQPDTTPVRNNLALAYAAAGDLDRARAEFARAGDAAAHYNLGMVHLAQGRFELAAEAFTSAIAERPAFRLAAARVKQTRALIVSNRDRQ